MGKSRMTTQAERKALLETAQVKQEEFWSAVRKLERAYSDDAEIGSSDDISGWDIDTLDAEMADAETNEYAKEFLGVGE